MVVERDAAQDCELGHVGDRVAALHERVRGRGREPQPGDPRRVLAAEPRAGLQAVEGRGGDPRSRVPQAVREAAFGLGIPQWRTTISITLSTARAGILTGIMLAFARIAGETAPLMFTALGNQFWSFSPNQPIAAVPLQIYTYALSPYDDWHRQAWAGALVLVALIVGTISLVRFIFAQSTLREAR